MGSLAAWVGLSMLAVVYRSPGRKVTARLRRRRLRLCGAGESGRSTARSLEIELATEVRAFSFRERENMVHAFSRVVHSCSL